MVPGGPGPLDAALLVLRKCHSPAASRPRCGSRTLGYTIG
jgi:hypothetical protein